MHKVLLKETFIVLTFQLKFEHVGQILRTVPNVESNENQFSVSRAVNDDRRRHRRKYDADT
jgi:hypothetical protein